MDLDDLIAVAASNERLLPKDVESVATEMGLSVSDLLDAFARRVASEYLHGRRSFAFADGAITQLFVFAIADTGIGLSEFVWDVYGAFDEGEYLHEGMPDEEQGERLTRKLLGEIGSFGAA